MKKGMVVEKIIEGDNKRGILQSLKGAYQEVLEEEADMQGKSLKDVSLEKTPQGLQVKYTFKI